MRSGIWRQASGAALLCLAWAAAAPGQLFEGGTEPAPDATRWPAEADRVTPATQPARLSVRLAVPAGGKMAAATPGGEYVLVAGLSGDNATLFDLVRNRLVARIPGRINFGDEAVLSPDGTMIAASRRSGGNTAINIGALTPPRQIASVDLGEQVFDVGLTFTPDKTLLACVRSGADSTRLIAFDTKARKQLWETPAPKDLVRDVWALSPGGRYLALATKSTSASAVALYDVPSGQETGALPLPASGSSASSVHGLAFSDDGAQFAVLREASGGKMVVHLYDAATGKVVDTIHAGDLPTQSSFDRPRAGNLAFLGPQHLLLFGHAIVQRGVQGYVGTAPLTHAERRLPVRVLRGAWLVRLTEGDGARNAYLVAEAVDFQKLATGAAVREAGGKATELGMPLPIEADVSKVQWVKPLDAAAVGAWQVQPDPAPAAAAAALSRPIALPFAPPQYVVAAAEGSAALGGAFPNVFGAAENPVAWFDLKSGQAKSLELPLSKVSRIVALSRDGARGLFVTEGRLDAFDLPKGTHVAGFRPVTSAGAEVKALAAMFLDKDRLLVRGGDELSAWSIANATLLWAWKCQAGAMLATPGGRYVVVCAAQVVVLDAADGQLVGRLTLDARSPACMAASPDGKRLALFYGGMSSGELCVYDLATGRLEHSTPTPEIPATAGQLLSERHALLGQYLIDIPSGAAIWSYERPGQSRSLVAQSANSRLWYFAGDGGRHVLASAAVPEPAVLAAVRSAGPAGKPLVGPGAKVSIQAQMDDAEKAKLRGRLAAAGVQVVDDAPIRLVSSINTESLGTKEYTVQGRRETLSESRTIRRLEWVDAQGTVLWSMTSMAETRGGFMHMVQEGKSLQESLGAGESRARTQTFTSDSVPVLVYPKAAQCVAGWSELTPSGPKPVPAKP